MAYEFNGHKFRHGTPKLTEIDIGAITCSLIKRVYFAESQWSACCCDVAHKFIKLKAYARDQLAGLPEEGILDILRKYDEDDLREALDGQEKGR